MTDEPIILAEDGRHARRLIQLEAFHEIDYSGSVSLLYTASLMEGGVKIRRISSEEALVEFWMDANVINALCAGWTKFNDDQAAKQRAEDERQNCIIAEAYDIVQACPAVKVEESGPNCWRVSCPDSGWIAAYPAQNAESLIRDVKNARDCYQRLLPAIQASVRE